jgi:prophage DNA circulation protein
MSTADDLRDLRDALDCIAHGALPRWGTMTTKLGGEAQTAAREVYERFVRAIMDASNARFTADSAKGCEDQQRAHAEALTARCEAVEAEVERLKDRCASYSEDVESLNGCVARLEAALYEARDEAAKLRAERRQLRRRLVECRPWVGACPYPNTPGFDEVMAIRGLADDTLAEVKE